VTVALLDDHLLLEVLLTPGRAARPVAGALATTGLWYHRLGRALIASPIVGALSRRLEGLDDDLAQGVIGAVTTLPPDIELMSLRALATPMARLIADGCRLNLLSLEALAAAQHLGATIHLAAADANAPLVREAGVRGVHLEVVEA
jgi:hypothetical protein